jgi:putative transposase
MLSPGSVGAWISGLRLSIEARSTVENIRASGPSRLVGGGRMNVAGRYPSRKMGVTIQFESHRVELAFLRELEHDSDVLEYYDQPPSFRLEYRSACGRRVVVSHTPDYFVIHKNGAEWHECKTEEELDELAKKQPNRYCRRTDGGWSCPPGERHANQFGFSYRIRSSKEVNWVFQRNMLFLEDYLRADVPPVDVNTKQAVQALVSEQPGISLVNLFKMSETTAHADDVYSLIARDELWADLRSELLAEPNHVRVFLNRDQAAAHEALAKSGTPERRPRPVDLKVGSAVSWDGRTLKIVNMGDAAVGLVGQDWSLVEVPIDGFEALIKEGRVTSNGGLGHDSEVVCLLREASADTLTAANERVALVLRRLAGSLPRNESPVAERTLRGWIARYRMAEEVYCSGYVGLLPQTHRRGNRSRRLPDEVAAMENTTPSPSGSLSTGGSPATGQQHGWQRTRPLVSGPGQSPLCGAFQCLLQIARTSNADR